MAKVSVHLSTSTEQPGAVLAEGPRETSSGSGHVSFKAFFLPVLGTSILSKASTMVVQLVAVPLVLVSCGKEIYAAYLLLMSSLAWLSMSNLGLGPGLTVRYGNALGLGDFAEASRLFNIARVATVALGGVSLASGIGLVALLSSATTGRLSNTIEHAGYNTLFVAVGVVVLQTMASIPEAIRTADGSQQLTNLAVTAGNVAGLMLAFAFSHTGVTQLWLFVLAIFGCPVLARTALNVRYLFGRRWPWIPVARMRLRESSALLGDGLWALSGSASNYASHQAVLAFNPYIVNASDISSVGTCLNFFSYGAGLISLAGPPLMAYVSRVAGTTSADAQRRLLIRTLMVVGTIGVAVYVACETVLPALIPLFFRGKLAVPDVLLRWMGAYYVFATIELAVYSYLAGATGIRTVSKICLFRGVASYALAVALTGILGNQAVFIGPLLAVLAISLPLYFSALKEQLRNSSCASC